MVRIGLYPALIIIVFGAVIPCFIFKLGRLIGLTPLLALGLVVGLAYGAVKSEYPWYGNGLLGNATLMAASALILVAYVWLSYVGAGLVRRGASYLRRE
jgi:hypothetical protein